MIKTDEAHVWTDGGGNTGYPCACAAVVDLFGGEELAYAKKLPDGTNNVAEYEGVILGLTACIPLGVKSIVLHSDSQLIVNQLTGRYRVSKDADLARLRNQAITISSNHFEKVDFIWVPREQNRRADQLCRKVLRPKSPRKRPIPLLPQPDAKGVKHWSKT